MTLLAESTFIGRRAFLVILEVFSAGRSITDGVEIKDSHLRLHGRCLGAGVAVSRTVYLAFLTGSDQVSEPLATRSVYGMEFSLPGRASD